MSLSLQSPVPLRQEGQSRSVAARPPRHLHEHVEDDSSTTIYHGGVGSGLFVLEVVSLESVAARESLWQVDCPPPLAGTGFRPQIRRATLARASAHHPACLQVSTLVFLAVGIYRQVCTTLLWSRASCQKVGSRTPLFL